MYYHPPSRLPASGNTGRGAPQSKFAQDQANKKKKEGIKDQTVLAESGNYYYYYYLFIYLFIIIIIINYYYVLMFYRNTILIPSSFSLFPYILTYNSFDLLLPVHSVPRSGVLGRVVEREAALHPPPSLTQWYPQPSPYGFPQPRILHSSLVSRKDYS